MKEKAVLIISCKCLLLEPFVICDGFELGMVDSNPKYLILFPLRIISRAILGGMLGSGVLKEGNPMAVHFVMFLPTILGQGTTEQQVEWLGRAWSMNILGTYAQTELGMEKMFFLFSIEEKQEMFLFNQVMELSSAGWKQQLLMMRKPKNLFCTVQL